MRGVIALPVLMLALASQDAPAAAAPSISFVHLATDDPSGGFTAKYVFSFTTNRNDFTSGTVYFNLANGVRYGCGVHALARCTVKAAGQKMTLIGLENGIQGTFFWKADRAIDNRPLEITIGIPQSPEVLRDYVSSISLPLGIPEPASWGMMVVGFAVLGAAVRRSEASLA